MACADRIQGNSQNAPINAGLGDAPSRFHGHCHLELPDETAFPLRPSFLSRLLGVHNRGNCPREDHDILEQRPLAHVFEVKRDPLLIRREATPTDLPQAGNAGASEEVVDRVIAVEVKFFGNDRPWSYAAHLAAKDVQQLGKLVEARFT